MFLTLFHSGASATCATLVARISRDVLQANESWRPMRQLIVFKALAEDSLETCLDNVRAHPRARTRRPARVGWSALLGSCSSSSRSCRALIIRAADARFARSAGEFRSGSSPPTASTSGGPHGSPRPADAAPDSVAVTSFGSLSFVSFVYPTSFGCLVPIAGQRPRSRRLRLSATPHSRALLPLFQPAASPSAQTIRLT